MNKIKQFRFFQNGNNNNSPAGSTYASWITGDIFNGYLPIVQLGIQSVPGAKFYLNNSNDPIIIGPSGIFELELTNGTEIQSLSFNINTMSMINENPTSYLIVDIVYDE